MTLAKMTVLILCFCFHFIKLEAANPIDSEYDYLDQLALDAGTDKASNGHDYMQVYARYFAPLRNQPIKFLEIGIAREGSVKLWERYFTQAELHFIDNAYITNTSNRSHYHVLDQGDAVALQEFVKRVGGEFDVIIDDGGHFMTQQITSFQNLFKHLKSGGLYIIEDLHSSYWTGYGGNGDRSNPLAGKGTTVELLKNLVEDINYTGAVVGWANWKEVPLAMKQTLTEYQSDIFSIHFYKCLCIIEKR